MERSLDKPAGDTLENQPTAGTALLLLQRHCLANTLRMGTVISPAQWQPWTARGTSMPLYTNFPLPGWLPLILLLQFLVHIPRTKDYQV